MTLTTQQLQLLDFVKLKHGDQVRKYTGDPYYTHLVNVAEIISQYEPDCIEIALCHDLFEDTQCNFNQLYNAMIKIGYSRDYSYDVCTCVTELTDVFTHADYPYMNRKKRKLKEAERLGTVSYRSQSVKYADLIDNTKSIVEYDEGFAKLYLEEKQNILQVMTKGNQNLFYICKSQIYRSSSEKERMGSPVRSGV